MDLTVDGLRAADPSTTYGEDEAEKGDEREVAARNEGGKLMSVEDMEALRTEVFSNLKWVALP